MKPAIAALKAWALAEVLMAAVYAGQWRSLRLEPSAAPAPPASPLVTSLELAYLLPFLAAVALGLRWWLAARPPMSAALGVAMLAYGLASLASFALWSTAETLGQVRQLLALDAGIALLGLWPALAAVAFIRNRAASA